MAVVAQCEVFVHRSGRPIKENVNISIWQRGSLYSRGYTKSGRALLRVPENSPYTVMLDLYKYEYPVGAHWGLQTVSLDFDARGIR